MNDLAIKGAPERRLSISIPTINQCVEGMDLAQQMHKETSYHFLDFDRERIVALIAEALAVPETWFIRVVVDEAHGGVIGFMMGSLAPYFFCADRFAGDLCLYVAKGSRGTLAAKRLIETFKQWGIDNGAREICLGISSNVHPERVSGLYERLGIPRIGYFHRMRVEG